MAALNATIKRVSCLFFDHHLATTTPPQCHPARKSLTPSMLNGFSTNAKSLSQAVRAPFFLFFSFCCLTPSVPDSKWFRWNNAYKSMAAHPVLLASIDDARDLQGIATATIEFLKRKVAKDSGGADQDAVPPPLQPKKRSRVAKDDARPTKRSASDSVAQRARVAERREERVELRSSRSMPPPPKTADQLRFWYLG